MGFHIESTDDARRHILDAYNNHYDIFKEAIRCFLAFMCIAIKSEYDYGGIYDNNGQYTKDIYKFMNGDGYPFEDEAEYIIIAEIIKLNVANLQYKKGEIKCIQ